MSHKFPWFVSMALRHLSGKNTRPAVKWMNAFALIAIFFAVFAWISVMSIMSGLQEDMRSNILSEKPHLLWEGRPRKNPENLDSFLAERPMQVESYRSFLQSEGLLQMQGVDERERVRGVLMHTDPSVRPGTVHLGQELADVLMADLDLPLSLRSVWRLKKSPLELKVSQVLPLASYEMNRRLVSVHPDDLGAWLNLQESVSRVEIRLKDPFQAEELKETWSRSLGLTLSSWQENDAALWYSLKLEKIAMGICLFFALLLAALALNCALSVRVTEKRREIALIRALGSTKGQLGRIFLIEGLILAFVACLLALPASYLFCRFVENSLELPQIFVSTHIPVKWSWSLSMGFVLLSFIMALLASWGPARRASQYEIAPLLKS